MPDFTVTVTNGTQERDGQAARFVVNQENARRAALDPPEPELPISPGSALRASYQTALGYTLSQAHENYIRQAGESAANATEAKERWAISSDAQRLASVNALEPLPNS